MAPDGRQAAGPRQYQPALPAPLFSRPEPFLSNRVFKTYDDIADACASVWNASIKEKNRIASITTRDWASVIT
jgi:hypothetical protein